MKKYNKGLVVGKFCPLHKGHELLINTALEQCDSVMIISYTSTDFGFSEALRREWLETLFPTAIVYVGDSRYVPKDVASESIHRSFCGHVAASYRHTPNAVFTSESYGHNFASHLSVMLNAEVEHVCVDINRTQVPISGTRLRADEGLWPDFTSAVVRKYLERS